MRRWEESEFEKALQAIVASASPGPDFGSVANRIGRLIPWEFAYRYDMEADEHPGEVIPPCDISAVRGHLSTGPPPVDFRQLLGGTDYGSGRSNATLWLTQARSGPAGGLHSGAGALESRRGPGDRHSVLVRSPRRDESTRRRESWTTNRTAIRGGTS